MPFYPPTLTGNACARSGHDARRAPHLSGSDTVEPLDVFPQYSNALRHVVNEPLPNFLLQHEAPPPVQEPQVQHGRDAWSNLRRSIYNNPRPHGVQQAREVEDAGDIDLFTDRSQPLSPDNPYQAAVEPLAANSLHRYCALAMEKPYAETRHAAELLSMGDDECVLIDAVRAYIAFETDRHVDGAHDSLTRTAPDPCADSAPFSAAAHCAAPDMDGVLELQDFDHFQIITYTPVPAADPAPPRYLLWLDGGGAPAAVETGSENQVVLCASNAEDAHSPGWALG